MPSRRVSTATRVSLACAALLAVWQIAWLADQADRLHDIIPDPWSVGFWLTAWTITLVVSVIAAASGHDRTARIAFGILAVVQVMGIATSIADGVPMGRQFWQVGSAGLICGWCFAMLTSPLRSVPTRDWSPHA